MRFRIKIALTGKGPHVLPVNYQYPISAWIYKVIHNGNNGFATWLHQQGYLGTGKQYKLFTFSQLQLDKFHLDGDRLIISNPEMELIISFWADEAAEPFIKGIFTSQTGTLGDQKSKESFRIIQIEKLIEPEFTPTMHYKTLSPIVVSKRRSDGNKNAVFIGPEDEDFTRILKENLINKYSAWMMSNSQVQSTSFEFGTGDFKYKLFSKAKTRLISIKANTPQQTRVKGNLFEFSLTAPHSLHKMGYHAGFGEKNSLGFGCVEVVKEKK